MEEPSKIEFDGEDEDKPVNLPVYLRIKPLKDSEGSSLKVIDDTTVETNHGEFVNRLLVLLRIRGTLLNVSSFLSTNRNLHSLSPRLTQVHDSPF